MSTSSKTTIGLLPPSSRETLRTPVAALTITCLPVASEPVKATFAASGCAAMAAPTPYPRGGATHWIRSEQRAPVAASRGKDESTEFKAQVVLTPAPTSTLSTPAGSPASAQMEAKTRADSGVSSEGLSTHVQPAARHGATFHAAIWPGAGGHASARARARVRVKARASQSRWVAQWEVLFETRFRGTGVKRGSAGSTAARRRDLPAHDPHQ